MIQALAGYSYGMTEKKQPEQDQPQGTKQETADDSQLGQKPVTQPADDGPRDPSDSPYA